VTGAGVDVLAARSVEALRTYTVRHPSTPGRWTTDPGVEAWSSRTAGTQPGLTHRAPVPIYSTPSPLAAKPNLRRILYTSRKIAVNANMVSRRKN